MGFSAEQKLAIECIGGPQIVLAGPGSGKTLIIVEKAAYLVEQKGIKPDEILILTYNNFTADELNSRLRKREKEKPLPEAKTFHSFGQRVIEQRYEILGYKDVPTILGSFRKYLIQREAYFQAAEIPPGLSSPDNIIKGVDSFISRANDELVGPAELFGYIDKKEKELANLTNGDQLAAENETLTDLKFAARFHEIYNRKKVEKGFIDFDDMLFGLYRIFKHNQEALKIQRHKLKYILVDEFQDANSGQVETLALLAGSSGKICVVGDDDQSIYRFRGASYGSFVNFTRLFPNAVTHKLTINFRSTLPIVAAAQTLISYKTQARFDPYKKIKSNNENGRKIGSFISLETESEGRKVAGLIKAIMQDDPQIKPDDIAVISRAHDHRKEVRKALASEGIPAVEQRPVSVFSVFEAHLAASFLRGALADDQPEWLFPILLKYAPGLGPTIYSQISESLKSFKPFELLDNLKSDEQLSSFDKSGLEYAIGLLRELRANVPNCKPAELVEKLLVSSGLFSQSLTNDKSDDLASRALARLWAAAAEYEEEFGSDIREFLQYLIWTEQTDALNLEPSNEKGVYLMTAHSAKGLEFSVVIVIGLSERKFPQDNRTGRFTLPQDLSKELPPPADAHIQEERRLMYVAMTRAAGRLYLSGLERNRVKISRFFSEVAANESFAEYGESINFTTEEKSTTDDNVIQIDDTNAYAVKIAEIIGGALNSGKERLADSIMFLTEKLWATLSHGKQKVSPDEFKKILTDIIGKCELKEAPTEIIAAVTKPRLSYTDIETYDKCPLQYKFKKILKVPEKAGPQIFLGEAIHGTLQEAMTKAMSDKMPTVDELKAIFLVKWQSYHHSDTAWMEGLKNAGLSMLEKFAEREKANKYNIIAIERKFTIDGDNFMLNGRIDRVDIDDAGDFYIIDYKTGKIGMPEGSYEKKDDQLTVYAMACPSLFGKLPKAVTYYFLGDDKLVSNIISEKDINKVRERIGETADNIISGNFEAKPSGFICPRCSYRTICPYKAE